MAIQTLNDLATYGEQRTKINANDAELDTRLESIEEKVGASAYIRGGSVTCTLADTYYPITGAFTNKELSAFTLGTNLLNYTGLQTLVVEIATYISTQSSKNGAILTFAILKNGVEIPGSDVSREFATGTTGSMATATTEELSTGDTIQIVVKSTIAANNVTLLDINSTLKRFY